MNKILRVSALTLSLVALLAAAVFFTVQAAARPHAEVAYGQDIEAAVLKQGSRGEDVKTVQRKLKNWGYYSGSVDGIYGPATKKAVEYFQRKNGLTADGIVGRKTFGALGMMQQAGQGGQSGQSPPHSAEPYSNSQACRRFQTPALPAPCTRSVSR